MFTVISALLTTLATRTAPLRARMKSDLGLEAVEYALIAALLAAVVVGAMAILGPQITAIFQAIADQLTAAATNVTP